ncbi:MAG: ABC transporter ATP-binding protein [Muribaculaceae bacterium]|nr:ABC transporter ATP-binding protein [Muribaculaceae bacterium]
MSDLNNILIEVSGLSIGYGSRRYTHPLLTDINFNVSRGDVVLLVGPNGAGKSTLLRTIAGLQSPLAGSVSIMGRDINKFSTSRLSRAIAMVYTGHTGGGGLTVHDLVAMGRHPYTGFLGHLSSDDHRIIDTAINRVGLYNLSDKYLANISDGERQKAMIARAIVQDTPIIMLDEPTSFLDVAARIETSLLLANLAKDSDRGILLSTHDISSALKIATHILAINPHTSSTSFLSVSDPSLPMVLTDLFADRGIIFDQALADFRPTII